MSCAIVVYGEIGSGKTRTCLKLAEKARDENITIGGILSTRVYRGRELIGYNGLDMASSQVFPLARLRKSVDGSDWLTFSNLIYAFSMRGFERANRILVSSVDTLDRPSIVFVDEFGRLELERLGIYPGALRVAEALKDGGLTIFACRTDMVEAVEGLVGGRGHDVFRHEPREVESLWRTVLRCLRHAC